MHESSLRLPLATLPRTVPGAIGRRVKRLSSPARGDLRTIRFHEGGAGLAAYVPDEEVFTLCRELILDRVYERGGISLEACTGTVVDAGAHVGIFSLRAAQWARNVVAIEADDVNLATLEVNLRRNGITNVTARHGALWAAHTDALTISASHHSGGGAVGPARGGRSIASCTLDDLVDELGPIDLLKIDVEGAEFDIVATAARLSEIRRIAGEVHLDDPDDPRLTALVGRLRDEGFAVTVLDESELLGGSETRRRIRRHWSSLDGELAAKLLLAAYVAAPVRKPVRPAGARYRLPILLATRPGSLVAHGA